MNKTYKGHTDSINCLAVFPEDGTFVSGSDDGTLRLWTKDAEASLRTFEGHTQPVTCVATFADGTFVSGSADKTIRLWDKATGETLRTFTCHTAWINCLATYPDGTFLSGSSDKTLRLWNKTTGTTIQSYIGHTSAVLCVATFDDGTFVSGASNMGVSLLGVTQKVVISTDTLRFWHKDSGCSRAVFPVSRIGSVYSIITFSDKTFISVCEDEVGNSQVAAWKTDLLKPIAIYKGHDELEVNCIEHLPPKNNQNRFITSGCDGTLCVWTVGNLTPNRSIKVHHDCFNAIAALSSGEVVVATKKADDLFLWSTDPEFRPVPAGSENMITGEDIVDGNEMVNLVRQTDPKVLTNYNAGTFFKDSEGMRALTVHPVSRRALGPQNFHPYLARVEPTATAATAAVTASSRRQPSRRRRHKTRKFRTRTRRM